MSRPHVYVTRKVPDAALQIIFGACAGRVWESAEQAVPRRVLLNEVAAVDGLYILHERVDAELLARAPRLRVVANMGAGTDHIDIAACTARGILVTNTPGVVTETVADLVFGLMLAAGRRIVEGHQLLARDEWKASDPLFMTGVDVHGRTLGIIGAGRIGTAVARRARGFGMRILYHNRHPNAAVEAETGAEYRSLASLLPAADFVVVLAPLTPLTRGLIGAPEMALMKDTAVLVNASRGSVVDEGALYQALRAGRIFAAAVDVYDREPARADHPFLTLSNCVCTPHIGTATVSTRTRMATLAAENLVAALAGQRPPTPVNPEVLDRGSGP